MGKIICGVFCGQAAKRPTFGLKAGPKDAESSHIPFGLISPYDFLTLDRYTGERSRHISLENNISMKNKQSYFAFLLRLWRMGGVKPYIWRASLEDPHTGEQRGFAGLDSLLKHLLLLTGDIDPSEIEENNLSLEF